MIDHNKKTSVALVFGKRGSGKTTLVKELLKKHDRYIVIDKLGEYPGVIVSNEMQALRIMRKKPEDFKIIIRLEEPRPQLFDILYCVTDYLLVVEELSFFCSSHKIDKGLFSIMAYGRHRGIDFIGVTQRPAQMNPLIRTQADTVYSFKMCEPIDQKYLEAYGLKNLEKLKQFKYIRKEV